MKHHLLSLLLLVTAATAAAETVFSGSTPGGDYLKAALKIPRETGIDFIRWELHVSDPEAIEGSFRLHLRYGIGKPNTLDFIGGGQTLEISGRSSRQNPDPLIYGAPVLVLHSAQFSGDLHLLRINDNLLHLLSERQKLLPGNGGWSYTLNRVDAAPAAALFLCTEHTSVLDTATQLVFTGRTPCRELASEKDIDVPDSCFKLKWKITLLRDPLTRQPASYQMRRIDRKAAETEGSWTLTRGLPANPDVLVITLLPGNGRPPIALLAADDQVLFFLHNNRELFTGNADFSFTLNRE